MNFKGKDEILNAVKKVSEDAGEALNFITWLAVASVASALLLLAAANLFGG